MTDAGKVSPVKHSFIHYGSGVQMSTDFKSVPALRMLHRSYTGKL